jgi:hypothetical protein
VRLTSTARLALGASASAVLLLSSAGSAAASAATSWGTAIEVPGLAALNAENLAALNALSCGASGDCAAGGSYFDSSFTRQAFVVDETGGTWGQAVEVPGTAALNAGGSAEVNSVSCASAGNCVAGGDFADSSGNVHAFVDSETGGTWGQAIEVPGSYALTDAGLVQVEYVSCPRADVGDCALAGLYWITENGHIHFQAFVDTETGGTWGQAEQVPGTGPSSGHNAAHVNALSCPAAGDCLLAGGFNSTAYLAIEKNGVWGHYQPVPGLSALNAGKADGGTAASCTSAADCSAGGYYTDSAGHQQAYVVTKHNGVWGKAQEVPGTAALNAGGLAQLSSVDCTSAGNCSAVGSYETASGTGEPFVVTQAGGTWGQADAVPGIANLDEGHGSSLVQVSCKSAGNCAAVGSYNLSTTLFNERALVVDQSGGVWQHARQVPGAAALDAQASEATAVSCPLDGNCSLGGNYGGEPAAPNSSFVDSQS